MKTFVLIYKAMLLYTSAFSWCVFLMSADSILEHSTLWFFTWLGMNIAFVCLCKAILSYRDLYKFSGMTLLDKLINKKQK